MSGFLIILATLFAFGGALTAISIPGEHSLNQPFATFVTAVLLAIAIALAFSAGRFA